MSDKNKRILKITLLVIVSLLCFGVVASFLLLFWNVNKFIKLGVIGLSALLIGALAYFYDKKKYVKIISWVLTGVCIITYPVVAIVHHVSFGNSTTYGFEKIGHTQVLGSFRTKSLFDPYVFMNEKGEYQMYVSYRDKAGIALTTSKDGRNWSELEIVLPKGTGWESQVNRCSVVKKDSTYYMWYTGQKDGESRIGLATSSDGVKFERVSDTPVLVPEHHYEQKSVMNPCVIYDEKEDLFKMWYAAGENYEPDVIAYATSKDGYVWDKYENNPVMIHGENDTYDAYKVGGCDVHKLGDNDYLMFYIGYTDLHTARIMFARSTDGISWTKYNDKALISSTTFGFDGEACYKPAAIYDEAKEKWLLWYNGRIVNREYIGLAEAYQYDFWNYYSK